MAAMGLSMEGQTPKLLAQEMIGSETTVITVGCGVDVSACSAKFLVLEDWGVENPAGQDTKKVLEIRDEIERRVIVMLRVDSEPRPLVAMNHPSGSGSISASS